MQNGGRVFGTGKLSNARGHPLDDSRRFEGEISFQVDYTLKYCTYMKANTGNEYMSYDLISIHPKTIKSKIINGQHHGVQTTG
jgi:hypothetical protein